ncbi:MAG: bifunctional DNA-formamidopyrimidine glycosylase/DNA-(apurinic or apyrimidinic site) lyase [Calditrichia bacterium]
MPELPEVETTRRQLLPICKGETISEVLIHQPVLLKNCDAEQFRYDLVGRTIEDIDRLSKYLIFRCGEVFPVVHLGMSGVFLKDRADSKYPKHIHIEWTFESGKQLFYQDMRRFGKVWLYHHYPVFEKLGIDPISQTLTLEKLSELLDKRSTTMKLFLMDQQKLSGIGNIYASEILFESEILPQRLSTSLSEEEREKLFEQIHAVLKWAINNFGTTYSAYQTVNGEAGKMQTYLKTYQRHGEPCKRCTGIIEKEVMGSRSTFFCRSCQF